MGLSTSPRKPILKCCAIVLTDHEREKLCTAWCFHAMLDYNSTMPILERDPWRFQYFEGVSCPEHIEIPTEEIDAYRLFPNHRWVFNKLIVAESQDLLCGLHGSDPPGFPVFSKPVYNLRGMGTGSRILRSAKEYRRHIRPGHFWMELLDGEHLSSDVAVVKGEPAWWRHAAGAALDDGAFDYWRVLSGPRPTAESTNIRAAL